LYASAACCGSPRAQADDRVGVGRLAREGAPVEVGGGAVLAGLRGLPRHGDELRRVAGRPLLRRVELGGADARRLVQRRRGAAGGGQQAGQEGEPERGTPVSDSHVDLHTKGDAEFTIGGVAAW
jgi:hypothetical protein